MKIDLFKAFGSLNWDFIFNLLQAAGFSLTYIKWIKSCITSPWYSISVNGSLAGFFLGLAGIRQGDPLSQYIFVLAMEVLIQLLHGRTKEGRLGYHPKCKGLGLTHSSFADDILIFTECSVASYRTILEVFHEFCKLSGLKLCSQKSKVYVTAISTHQAVLLCDLSGFKQAALPVRCLGIPMITPRLRAHDCQLLVHKITTRVCSWISLSLSYADRLQLIASVLQSISQFWCSHFILPKKFIHKIEQTCSAFLWNGKKDQLMVQKLNGKYCALLAMKVDQD